MTTEILTVNKTVIITVLPYRLSRGKNDHD